MNPLTRRQIWQKQKTLVEPAAELLPPLGFPASPFAQSPAAFFALPRLGLPLGLRHRFLLRYEGAVFERKDGRGQNQLGRSFFSHTARGKTFRAYREDGGGDSYHSLQNQGRNSCLTGHGRDGLYRHLRSAGARISKRQHGGPNRQKGPWLITIVVVDELLQFFFSKGKPALPLHHPCFTGILAQALAGGLAVFLFSDTSKGLRRTSYGAGYVAKALSDFRVSILYNHEFVTGKFRWTWPRKTGGSFLLGPQVGFAGPVQSGSATNANPGSWTGRGRESVSNAKSGNGRMVWRRKGQTSTFPSIESLEYVRKAARKSPTDCARRNAPLSPRHGKAQYTDAYFSALMGAKNGTEPQRGEMKSPSAARSISSFNVSYQTRLCPAPRRFTARLYEVLKEPALSLSAHWPVAWLFIGSRRFISGPVRHAERHSGTIKACYITGDGCSADDVIGRRNDTLKTRDRR